MEDEDPATTVNAIKHKSSHRKPSSTSKQSSKPKFSSSKSSKTCFNCGLAVSHDTVCPAKGKECKACHRIGHYARCCMSSNPNLRPKRGKPKHQVNNIDQQSNADSDSESSSDDSSQ